MMLDYMTLTDACERQAGEEVLMVMDRLIADCWDQNKVGLVGRVGGRERWVLPWF
jgi:hypothetical protein